MFKMRHLFRLLDGAEHERAYCCIDTGVWQREFFCGSSEKLQGVTRLLKRQLGCFICIWLHFGIRVDANDLDALYQNSLHMTCLR